MECSSISKPLPPSLFPPKPVCNRLLGFPYGHAPWKQQKMGVLTTRKPAKSHSPRCQKMFVPGFGEASPEAKAANYLHDFFTYVAVKIVCAQLESYNPEAYQELMEFISTHSVNKGDEFCAGLMRVSSRHKGLALRILEVRSAYCKQDFEWDNLKRLSLKKVGESNTRLMREYLLETSDVEKTE